MCMAWLYVCMESVFLLVCGLVILSVDIVAVCAYCITVSMYGKYESICVWAV